MLDLEASVLSESGEIRRLGDLVRGTTLIFYFSPACGHCEDSAPDLAEMARRLGARGLTTIAVASGSASSSEAEAFARRFGFDFPTVHDTTTRFKRANQIGVTPSAFLVRETGERLLALQPWYHGADFLVGMALAGEQAQDPWSGVEADRYFGSQVCGSCHALDAESWGLTYHSAAYFRLDADDRERPECVGCHVTGMGRSGGFEMERPVHELAAVGCESCHGPGGAHGTLGRTEGSAAAAPAGGEAMCLGCHDAKHSLMFDYEAGLRLIDHRSAMGMDAESYRERRLSVFKGEAPRTLLRMPEGERIGDHACARCHKKAARKSRCGPHGKGQAGCEDCHGPGAEHAQSESATDILGLGDTCPVCVLNELCRSCHTPAVAPEFDLDSWLPKIKHGVAPSRR
jgi:thiol-disulfide isomerase/thioredoxin